jgi:hypothetical protein
VRGQPSSFGQGKQSEEPDLEDVDEDDFVWRGQVDGVDGRHLHTMMYHHQVSQSQQRITRTCMHAGVHTKAASWDTTGIFSTRSLLRLSKMIPN